ncbi:MAG: Type 1 glutamine amidotransferase-like domain-containing protein [Candidatus Kerfeldbacteria bacterium]
MKRLLLTSSGEFVTDGKLDFFGMRREDLRWAYIITAGKNMENVSFMEVRKKRMNELKYDFTEIDIDNKTENEVRKELKDFDVIYVEGGDTFYLLKAIRNCNFKAIIEEKIEQGVIYVGSSAGAYITCPTIEMATWINSNNFSYHGLTDFTGMSLVPFFIYAHYEEGVKDILKEKMRYLGCNTKILNDEQALRIEDNKIELLGDPIEIYI